MIRDTTIPFSKSFLAKLRLIAEVDGLDSAETALELIVRAALDARPEIAERAQMRADALKQADKDLLERAKLRADALEKADKEWRAKWLNKAEPVKGQEFVDAHNAKVSERKAKEAEKAERHARIAEGVK